MFHAFSPTFNELTPLQYLCLYLTLDNFIINFFSPSFPQFSTYEIPIRWLLEWFNCPGSNSFVAASIYWSSAQLSLKVLMSYFTFLQLVIGPFIKCMPPTPLQPAHTHICFTLTRHCFIWGSKIVYEKMETFSVSVSGFQIA